MIPAVSGTSDHEASGVDLSSQTGQAALAATIAGLVVAEVAKSLSADRKRLFMSTPNPNPSKSTEKTDVLPIQKV